jgi:hypothetical protein
LLVFQDRLGNPSALVFDLEGNLYVSESTFGVVRVIAAGTGIITTYAGNATATSSGDNGPATSALLSSPQALAVDAGGNLYIAAGNAVRRVDAGTGTITTYAGDGQYGYSGDNGPAVSASFNQPFGLSFDQAGDLYIADRNDSVVRKVAAQTTTVTTVAGKFSYQYPTGAGGDGGPATAAELYEPRDVALDSSGNLYIAAVGGRIGVVSGSSGTISTIAGNGIWGSSGDGQEATKAELSPVNIALDSAGNIYITNWPNSVRRIPAGGGTITTIAGSGYSGFSGDGGSPTIAELNDPEGLAFDGAGNLYIADMYNNRIRQVSVQSPASAPALSLAAGSYKGTQSLTIADATPNAVIYYTTDGSTPNTGSTQYTGAIAVSQSETVSAIAVAPGYSSSVVASAYYTILLPTTPAITWPAPAAIIYGTPLSASQLDATASVLGTFAYSPASGAVLGAGQQTLTATFTPTDNLGYTIANASVTIVVNQATPTITWPAPAAITFGTALGASQLNATSSVAGTMAYSPAARTVLGAGSQTLKVTFTPTDPTDYTVSNATATLTVNKATPTNVVTSSASTAFVSNPVTFTAMLASSAGTPTGTVTFLDGTTQLGTGTLTAGVATYSTSSLTAGAHPVTASYAGDTNFGAVTSSALTETIEDFTFSAPSGGSTSATVSPGGTANYTLAVTPPDGGTSVSDITITVSGLPTGATATFNPTSVPAGSGPTNVTLSVGVPTTAAVKSGGSQAVVYQPKAGRFPLSLGHLVLPLLGLRRLRRAFRGKALLLILALAGTACLAAFSGCGGGSSKTTTQPQTYTLVVTATAGSLTHTTNLTLTVQ